MSAATVIAWLAWVAVLMNVNPDDAGWLGHAAFYVTLFVALAGAASLIGTLSRVHILKRSQLVLREVKIAVRHGIILALMAVISLILSLIGWFTWWTLALLLGILGAIEYTALLVQESRRS